MIFNSLLPLAKGAKPTFLNHLGQLSLLPKLTLNPVTAIKHKTNLTNHNTMTNLPAPRNIEVGICNPRRLGDNTPQLKAVFLRLPIFNFLKSERVHIIMVVLFEQPLRLVAPSRDIANSLNTAAQCFATLRDGLTTLRLGITA